MLLDHLSGQRTQVRVPPLFNEGGGFHELLILEQAWRIASKVTEPKRFDFLDTASPQDTWGLGVWTSQMRSFELAPNFLR